PAFFPPRATILHSFHSYQRYGLPRRFSIPTFWPNPSSTGRLNFSHTNSSSTLADLVQEMYLKELRAYKIPQPKPNDAEGHVQKFHPPPLPKSPEETNLA